MKSSFVSSAAVSQALRYSLVRAQSDLVKAQKEADSGLVADTGLALGVRTSQSVTFRRDFDRLNGIADSNALVTARLTNTQKTLTQIQDVAQSLFSTLTSGVSGEASFEITQAGAKNALASINSLLNSNFNGEYLFAGINTDAKPVDDAATKAAFEAAFTAHFSFPSDDPQAANITAAEIGAFMDDLVESSLLDGGWEDWSDATDQNIVSRVALNETLETSVNANAEAFRKLTLAAAAISSLLSSNINDSAKTALVEQTVTLVGEAIGDLSKLQATTGLTEQRVTDATNRTKMQADIYERSILDLEGVDPYEAVTRVNDILAQIEASYAMTARIQQLSLLRFLS